MGTLSVTSKGQVTIPVAVRKALGISPGTKVTISAQNGKGQITVVKQGVRSRLLDGAAMLKVKGKGKKLADFNAASLLKRGK
jgi:AbrB family looped-hinge helix DNA binding protein